MCALHRVVSMILSFLEGLTFRKKGRKNFNLKNLKKDSKYVRKTNSIELTILIREESRALASLWHRISSMEWSLGLRVKKDGGFHLHVCNVEVQ